MMHCCFCQSSTFLYESDVFLSILQDNAELKTETPPWPSGVHIVSSHYTESLNTLHTVDTYSQMSFTGSHLSCALLALLYNPRYHYGFWSVLSWLVHGCNFIFLPGCELSQTAAEHTEVLPINSPSLDSVCELAAPAVLRVCRCIMSQFLFHFHFSPSRFLRHSNKYHADKAMNLLSLLPPMDGGKLR